MSMGLCLTGSASTEEVSVEIGPVSSVGGTAVRIRSEHVGGTAFMLLAFTSEAVPSPFAGAPGLGVPLSSSLFTFALDASGDRDIPVVVPVTAPLGLLQARIQVVALAASGVLSKSNVAVTSLAPSPPGAFLQAGQEALPGAAFGSGAFSVRSGDFDLDGRPELLVQSSLGTEYWDNSSGAGGMSLVAKPDVFSGLPEVGGAYEIGDVNRDGFLDIVSGSFIDSSSGAVPGRVLLGDGAGGFVHHGDLPPMLGASTDVEMGDLDLDGDLDLFVATGGNPHTGSSGSPDHILWNDGSGVFSDDSFFATAPFNDGTAGSTSATLGDLNGDGFLEVVVGKTDPQGLSGPIGAQNQVIFVLGPGVIFDQTGPLLPTIRDNTNGLELADVDCDGDLDLVVANLRNSLGTVASGDLLINQGGLQGGTPGLMIEQVDADLKLTSSQLLRLGVTLFDADNDGDIDILYAVHDLPPGSLQPLYLNQGGLQAGVLGDFALATWFHPGDLIVNQSYAVDLDVDGDQDLLLPSTGSLSGDPGGADLHLFWGTTAK